MLKKTDTSTSAGVFVSVPGNAREAWKRLNKKSNEMQQNPAQMTR